jgi:hypothetical protein
LGTVMLISFGGDRLPPIIATVQAQRSCLQ